MAKHLTLTIENWGSGLAIRIPAALARSAGFTVGQKVDVKFQDIEVMARPVSFQEFSLEQKLALFDPIKHGGETMPSIQPDNSPTT